MLAAVAASAGPTMAVGCTLPYWLRYAITLTGISCREEIFKIRKVHISRFAVPFGTAAGFLFFRRSSSSSSNCSMARSPAACRCAKTEYITDHICGSRLDGRVIRWYLWKQKAHDRSHLFYQAVDHSRFPCNLHQPLQRPVTPRREIASTTASFEARSAPSVTSGSFPQKAP